MSGLFNDLEKNKKMIIGAFKKLKLYYYYDKTQLYNKAKLSIWENDKQSMDIKVHELAVFLKSLEDKTDYSYFNKLLKEIDFSVFPKAFSEGIKEDIISNIPKKDRGLSKVNFFIKAPVEILIIDMIWTLFIGKISHDNNSISSYAYANKLKFGSIFTDATNLYDGIDFKSNIAFEPYFKQYTSWRDNSFKILKNRYYSEEDSILISLDIKSYYYSVKFKFENLNEYLNKDIRLQEFSRMSELIQTIYISYTAELQKYRGKIPASCKENECAFPIGLLSCSLLANLYLKEFDQSIITNIAPVYYGRYVDDIIIISNPNNYLEIEKNQTSILHEILVNLNVVKPKDNNVFQTLRPEGLILQKDKIKCFFFDHNESSSIIDMICEKGITRASEGNLLPDICYDVNSVNSSFDSNVYYIDEFEGTLKIKDLFISTNNYRAIKFINKLVGAGKNINFKEDNYKKFIEQQFVQIMRFYSGVQGVEYRNAWINVFSLALINENYYFLLNFYNMVKDSINKLNAVEIEDIDVNKKDYILNKVKNDLTDQLKIAAATVLALVSDESIKSLLYTNDDFESIFKIAVDIRKANMFNHHLVAYPLLNYLNHSELGQLSYLESNLESISNNIVNSPTNNMFDFLDQWKLEFSPRFIHVSEFFSIYFTVAYKNGSNLYQNKVNDILNAFYKINNISDKPITIETVNEGLISLQKIITYSNNKFSKSRDKIKIALANICMDEFDDVLSVLREPLEGCSTKKKSEVFRLLNDAANMNADIIIFPEYYFPIAWVDQICKFSKDFEITIITGIQYITTGERAYNYSAVISPFTTKGFYQHSIPLLREKNDYAPKEQEMLSREGYVYYNTKSPSIRVISWNGFSYSDILCFELTNIDYRSILRTEIDAIFIPELNPDTNYFSSIVESTSRDLHCFVIQANTAKYGDSRITAPYNTNAKNILQIKGGQNSVVLLGEISLYELKEKRNRDQIELKERVDNNKGTGNQKDDKPDHEIKGLPARFDERRSQK